MQPKSCRSPRCSLPYSFFLPPSHACAFVLCVVPFVSKCLVVLLLVLVAVVVVFLS